MGISSHTRTKNSDLTMAYVAPSVPIGESVSARSSFKSVQRNRLSFDSAVPKIGRSEDQDFKGLHPYPARRKRVSLQAGNNRK